MKALNLFGTVGVDKSLKDGSTDAVRAMKRDAPEDTGRLKRKIGSKPTGGGVVGKYGVEVSAKAIDDHNGVDYAPFQEHGTRFIEPTPFFYKNIRGNLDNLVAKWIKMLNVIERI